MSVPSSMASMLASTSSASVSEIGELGGFVRARALFGAQLPALLDELTDTLVA